MNSPLRLLLVDDEAPARARLRDLLGDLATTLPTTVTEASAGAAALEQVQASEFDVVLVDIRMPEMDGIEFARHLARLPRAPAVIFVTAYDQYAVKAFELVALDYLVKPVRAARLADALLKARRRPLEAERLEKFPQGCHALAARHNFSCIERGRILLVPVTDVVYLKAEQKYVTARTPTRDYLLEESLVQLESEFAGHFVRIHRNCLAALGAVRGVEHAPLAESDGQPCWQIVLDGVHERLLISRRQWPLVKALFKRME
ncbi:MAG: DNA-binding response regulator [Betaproteobacteria bacterium HGW-Betaproteobacteria-11]|nr:MAG: DNA-binding response regulator [Betaproteobacteria bacterium HGW-Betaproteobacteria-11]